MIIRVIIFGILFMLVQVAAAQDNFQLSYSCINCHQDRYGEWSRSMHALAITDPVFEAAYMRAILSDPDYRSYCLTCHSPTTKITKDFNLSRSLSVEGVTCSFCHSVERIENGWYIMNQSGTMRGPYSDSKTGAHPSAYSGIHEKSEFCAPCHDFSINGVPVFQTYTEWKEGPYAAEGKQCQDCHMETKQGAAAKDGPVREKVYQHLWYGGHSGQFLEKAFQMESGIQRTGNRVKVTLNITNSNVGHRIPSGFPSRKVVLDLKVKDDKGNDIFSGQKVYTKTVVDQYGNEVADFWKAASIAHDNRIKPRETRMEVFEFDVPEGTGKIDTRATLTYQRESEVMQPVSMNVEIAQTNSTISLPSGNMAAATPGKTSEKSPGIGVLATGIIIVAAFLCLYKLKKM